MGSENSLKSYREGHDLSRTQPESAEQKNNKEPIFVVHKHAAKKLHYDLRLELDGVLKSWTVPKGPSLNPKDRRLCVETDDHPLEYATFEGVIPEGEYGAGVVMVWDIGTYQNASRHEHKDVSLKEGLQHGQIKFVLNGKKLKGKFVMMKTKWEKNWFLIKMKDEHASSRDILSDEPNSALSGRSMEEIEKAEKLNKRRGEGQG